MVIKKWVSWLKTLIVNEKELYPEYSTRPNMFNICGTIDLYKYRIYETETGFYAKRESLEAVYLCDKKELLLSSLFKEHKRFIDEEGLNWFGYDRIIISASSKYNDETSDILGEINYSYIEDSLYEYYTTNSRYIKENGHYYIYAYDLDVCSDRLFKMTLKDIVLLNIAGYMLSGNGFIYTKQYAGSWLNGHNSDYAYSKMSFRDFQKKLMPEILKRGFATM